MKLYQICWISYYILPRASQLYSAILQVITVMILFEYGLESTTGFFCLTYRSAGHLT